MRVLLRRAYGARGLWLSEIYTFLRRLKLLKRQKKRALLELTLKNLCVRRAARICLNNTDSSEASCYPHL